jgi:phosphotriesterase-related protein
MGQVMTVLGPVPASELGAVTMHEHLHLDQYAEAEGTTPPERVALLRDCGIPALRRLHDHGCHTLVDATPMPMRAEPWVYAMLAREANLHIVLATGFYREAWERESWEYAGCPTYPHRWMDPRVAAWDVEALADLLVQECEQGIRGSDVRAGIIKLASTRTAFTPLEEKAFRAGALAQRRTGLCITTHVEPGLEPLASPVAQLDLLEAAGADPSRVILGHVQPHLVRLPGEVQQCLDRGASLCITNLQAEGNDSYWRAVVDAIRRLFDAGFGDRLTLGLDWAFDNVTGPFVSCSWMPLPPYVYLFTHVLPRWKEFGLTDEEVTQILVRNPARLLPRV